MSDSEHSTVTYTSVSIPVEDDSEIGSPGVNGPPIMPEDPYAYIMAGYQVPPSPDYIPGPEVPPSPDYIPGPEVPPSPDYIPGPEEPQSPPPLDFVPEPMYPEYIPQEDEILPAEEQPLPAAASPTADSPGYVPESDPEEEPEEDDEDPEEDPADYPANGDDDDDNEDEDKEEEEEEEHPAPANSVPSVHRMTARISIRDEPSISLPPREEVERLLALTTPPPSPLTPLSSPLPQIPSPPLPIPSPPPNSPTHIEIPESCLPLQKRVRFASPIPSREVGESSVAGAARQDRPTIARDDPYSIAREDLYGFVDMVDVPPRCSTSRELDYGITDTWDDLEETTSMPIHRRLAVMIEREAKMAHEAWGLSMDASDYVCSDVMSLRTTVVAQSALISELQSTDHRRQRVILELLASDNKRQVQLTKTLSLLSIMGYSQLANCIDLLFCLATQYRSFVQKMAPKRKTTRLNPDATPTPVTDTHTTTSVTNAQIQAMINKGVTAALAAHDATRNGDDAYFRKGLPERPMKVARECTYPDFQMPTLELQGH
ncbi:hypothetical protein Tco_0683362 [Tanacetum coccineum]|uniref:Uncharacterized protein n=1 Tax=Tanacetum coccineum TaxID=301880 RepID=A0ABQ4XUZ3_9ASTR